MKQLHATMVYILVLACFFVAAGAFAASPTGADTFQLFTNVQTGNDNSGDGGTGNAADLNYYYVGQSFTTDIEIVSGGATAANIWIDYLSNLVTASNLTTGSFFNTWSGQVIDATYNGTNNGRIFSTGANIPVVQSSGTGDFGSMTWTAVTPTASNYGTGSPAALDIVTGTIGQTTDSNIGLNGVDLLDDVEDFQLHIWADTIKPYLLNLSPTNGAGNVPVDDTLTFTLCDSLGGSVSDSGTCLSSGVGTGVSTATPPGAISLSSSFGTIDGTQFDSYSLYRYLGDEYV